jgi:hypothetical protein
MRFVAMAGLVLLGVVCVLRRDALAAAIAGVPPGALIGLVALHLLALVARSEAWRLSLGAIGGASPQRMTIHTANAGAFVAGCLQPHAAMPARGALLRRFAPGETPHSAHIAVADLPIFLLEVAGAAVMLAVTGAWWAPRAAAAALLGARLAAGRSATRGLAVLADVRRRGALTALVCLILACGLGRIWLALDVSHLDTSPTATAAAFAALCVFGLLPLGPSAPPGALLVVSGGAGAIAAGLALSATSIAAVLVYFVALGAYRAQVRRETVQLERAEAVEVRVVGAVEVGRAGDEQAVLGAALDDDGRADGVVGRVEGLHPVHAELDEPVDAVDHGVGMVEVPERVRPHRDPARVMDERDRLGDRRGRAAAVGGRARHEISLQKLRSVHDLLGFKAHPVGWMVERGLSQMGATDRGALRKVEREAEPAQRLRHAKRTRGAVGAKVEERIEQRGRPVVDEVAEDMDVLALPVERGELDGGHESDAASRARLERLVDAVHRVMVGQRQQLDARVGGRRDHRARR